MVVKQVYFSEITEQHLISKANKQKNFSRYIKDLMQKENFIDELRHHFIQNAQSDCKPKHDVINQFV